MGLVDDALQLGPRPQQLVDLAHLGKQVKGLLVDSDAELPAGGVGLGMREAGQGRTAGRREDRARLAGQQPAGLDFAGAGGARHIDEPDRHVDGQNGQTFAGFREGLHDVYREGAVVVAPADDPAGKERVVGASHHVAILALR
jgi:hypothetical protein